MCCCLVEGGNVEKCNVFVCVFARSKKGNVEKCNVFVCCLGKVEKCSVFVCFCFLCVFARSKGEISKTLCFCVFSV